MSNNNKYAKNINFGKAINQNINRTIDPQNPLTMCIFPDLGTQFLHGATSSNYRPYCSECQNYMADRCSGTYDSSETWDDKCTLYANVNTDTYWPNQAAVNQIAAAILPSFRKKRTVGEQLLRNSLERRFIVYPQVNMTVQQFDPNIANSPYYRKPCNSCAQWQVRFINKDTIDQDRLMNAAIDNYTACADIFAIIWHAWKNKNLSNIQNTRLEKNLQQNGALYNDLFGRIAANMSRNDVTKGQIDSCTTYSSNAALMPHYQKGVPNCHK